MTKTFPRRLAAPCWRPALLLSACEGDFAEAPPPGPHPPAATPASWWCTCGFRHGSEVRHVLRTPDGSTRQLRISRRSARACQRDPAAGIRRRRRPGADRQSLRKVPEAPDQAGCSSARASGAGRRGEEEAQEVGLRAGRHRRGSRLTKEDATAPAVLHRAHLHRLVLQGGLLRHPGADRRRAGALQGQRHRRCQQPLPELRGGGQRDLGR